MSPASSKLVNVLRSTLKGLQKSEELASDDPALAELRESILSNITELEVAKTPKPPRPSLGSQKILWIASIPAAELAKESPSDRSQAPAVGEPLTLAAAPATGFSQPDTGTEVAPSRKTG